MASILSLYFLEYLILLTYAMLPNPLLTISFLPYSFLKKLTRDKIKSLCKCSYL